MLLIILACHIPYLFFSGKEAMLIAVDEVMRRSISLVLSKKMMQQEDIDEINAMPKLPEDEASRDGSDHADILSMRKSNKVSHDFT